MEEGLRFLFRKMLSSLHMKLHNVQGHFHIANQIKFTVCQIHREKEKTKTQSSIKKLNPNIG